MAKNRPRVSIGLPVFNGDEFLEKALDSIVAQTFSDFELIISDNASTDRTREICEAYAAKDHRIRYFRQKVNIGGGRNYNYVFEASVSEYFKWHAHDDFIAPQFLAECVKVLDANPFVVLCYSKFVDIDDQGNPLAHVSRNKAQSSKAYDRFFSLMSLDYGCEEVFGIIRTSILRKTKLIRNYTDSDRTLLCELALYGQFYEIPEVLFYHRMHRGSSVEVYPDWRARMEWFDPSFHGRIVFPHWAQCADYFKTIRRVPLGFRERTHCYFKMGCWLWYYGKGLAKDLLVALFRVFGLPLIGKLRPWNRGNFNA
jgi:glycosyltransferase involved in cell wall biosynthesis